MSEGSVIERSLATRSQLYQENETPLVCCLVDFFKLSLLSQAPSLRDRTYLLRKHD